MANPSSVLNTNIASLIAQRNLAGAQNSLAVSVERLSSGLRINRAKDDAAGMAVASVIQSQIKIAGTAHRNINDAMSMIQTAEGALQEATTMLTRIKELATQGANDSMSREQYYFLVQEMKQLMEELRNTAGRTTFNGNNLLGTFTFDENDAILGTPQVGQSGPWQFLSGAGADDFVEIDLIPIWASREEALEAHPEGYGDGAVKVGALNALYTRVAYLANPENQAIPTGEGYDRFALAPSVTVNGEVVDPNAPDGPTVIRIGGTYDDSDAVDANTMSLNDLVDEAILQINAHRSYFGAFYGRLEHNIANLSAQTENLTAALSRVQDTDYGAETANLTRVQILQQAATAMLAQANAMPNVILGLLRQQ
ncbi:MAG: flagellin [Betaproteobacteria bacterium]|nr:flagellin [Betaproteobacteria bacterium]